MKDMIQKLMLMILIAPALFLTGCITFTKAGHETARIKMQENTKRIQIEQETERQWNEAQLLLSLLSRQPVKLWSGKNVQADELEVFGMNQPHEMVPYQRDTRPAPFVRGVNAISELLNTPFGIIGTLAWGYNQVNDNGGGGGGGGGGNTSGGTSLQPQTIVTPTTSNVTF